MTLRHLKIFVEVCNRGGVTSASEALHITQPAVSHAISELEKNYNIILFDRLNQRLVLTPIGHEILNRARDIVREFEEFEEFAYLGGSNRDVYIGCSLTLGQTVIPSYAKLLKTDYPSLRPRITINTADVLERELESGNIDFALIEGDVVSVNLRAEPFKQDRIVVVANADFDVPDELMPDELAKYPLLLREAGGDYFKSFAEEYGLKAEPVMESANNQAIVSALYASLGIAFLPEGLVEGHIKRGKFKEIKVSGFDGNRTDYIVMHKNKKLTAAGKEAYDALKNMQRQV